MLQTCEGPSSHLLKFTSLVLIQQTYEAGIGAEKEQKKKVQSGKLVGSGAREVCKDYMYRIIHMAWS